MTQLYQDGIDPAPPPPRFRGLRRIWQGGRAVIETVLLGLLFYFLISQFVLQPFQVEQSSMEPTVEPGEYVLVDKLVTWAFGYHGGDIVVLKAPEDFVTQEKQSAPLIKRVIAVAGEHLQIRDGAVFIDGTKLDEPYLPAGTVTTTGDTNADLTIPAGEVWVMGDHRNASTDSRAFGPIKISNIIGHAVLRYWPLDRFALLSSGPTDATPAP